MNKTLLVIGVASIAGAAFILACTVYPPLNALFISGKTFCVGLLGQVTSFVTTNPLTAPIATLIGSGVTALVVRASAVSKQIEMAASASQERTDILSQAQGALSEQNSQIVELKAKIDALTSQVQETAQLKTEITSLQTKLSAAEQQAQRVRDEYNALIRIKAVAESLPVPESTVH
jgi:TolA-binding protein